jgi:hypothetical protein
MHDADASAEVMFGAQHLSKLLQRRFFAEQIAQRELARMRQHREHEPHARLPDRSESEHGHALALERTAAHAHRMLERGAPRPRSSLRGRSSPSASASCRHVSMASPSGR